MWYFLFGVACMLLSLTGCGGESTYPVDFTPDRTFAVQDDPRLMKDAQTVLVCVISVTSPLSQMPIGIPLLTVETTKDTWFWCGSVMADGCSTFSDRKIYITDAMLYTHVFSHEMVRQLDQDSSESPHYSAVMAACQGIEDF